MRRRAPWLLLVVLALGAGGLLLGRASERGEGEVDTVQGYLLSDVDRSHVPRVRSSFSPKNADDAVSRGIYELRRMQDPETGRIPGGIRRRELAHAAKLPRARHLLGKNAQIVDPWTARGPINVGGRTRALAVDLDFDGTTNQRILAGGVSGGMYLSEDNGQTWRLTTALTDLASVTCLAQDPNDRSVWYHGTGELMGASAGGGGAYARGHGIFKSVDGGNTWQKLPASVTNNHPNFFDTDFDHVWDVVVHPQTSAVFAATFAGIYRSQDGGASWQFVLGRTDLPASIVTDLTIAADGSVYAALSRNGGGFAEYGIYRSTDGGTNWTNVSPPSLVQDPWRMVVDAAPSEPNTVYAFVQATQTGAKAQEHQFFRYNAAANTWTDLSANLVDFPDDFGGQAGVLKTQGGYDMLVKVKPDDPNAIWIGGTNLMRSTDGGQSWDWVGGYHPQQFFYPNHHPDLHAMAFYPNDPDAAVSGHDGGLSVTDDVLMQDQTWTSISMGYVTSQFYAVAIDPQPNASNLLIGGLQDNGVWVTTSDDGAQPWQEATTGDGGFAAVAPGGLPHYVSTQLGNIMRASPSGNQLALGTVAPANAKNYLFIAPFVLDPNDPRVMYLAADNTVWRNSNLDDIPATNGQPTSTNWTQLTNSAVGSSGVDQVTALAVSKTPANRLYFGATDYQSRAVIKRVDNPASNPAGTDITPAGLSSWGYPSSIAVHPDDADELIVTFSNYNLESVWHSTDGGASWTNVEGNLGGLDGPSVRWAAIVPQAGGTPVYFLATSTGVYSTQSLSANTTWEQEGSGTIGNVVVDMIVARPEDGLVVAATHGRGVYSARLEGGGAAAVAAVDEERLRIDVRPGGVGEASFTLENTGGASLSYAIEANATGTPGEAGLVSTLVFEDAWQPSDVGEGGGGVFGRAGVPSAGVPSGPGRSAHAAQATDVLVLDDGDEMADDFIGFGDGTFVSVANRFDVTSDFQLEGVRFFMRTEQYFTNPVAVAVADEKDVIVAQGPAVALPLAPTGRWYDVSLQTPITFRAGKSFYLEVVMYGQFAYPAGVDVDAQATGKSFFRDPVSGLRTNLNTIQGFENGALLIRALGTQEGGGGGSNQPPQAFAQVSTNQPQVGETVTFDASRSNDADGQVVGYLWDFGDGVTSNQAIATHAYSAEGSYTLTLTVTDDDGATGQVSGQLNVTGGGGTNQAPEAVASISTTQPQVGQMVTFDASQSSDPDGQITAYAWNFGDGGVSNQAVATHAFAQAGTYTYGLQVTDNEGAIDQTTGTITVSGGGGGNQLPEAVAIVSETQPQVGESVTFDASQSSDPDGQITAYAWTFGDGGVSNQAVATHAFAQAGTYTYVLQVTDDQGGIDQATGSVTVSGGGTSRFAVTPATGALAPGANALVTVSFDATDIPEGSYTGEVVVSGNGGTLTLPIDVTVSSTVDVEEAGPERFAGLQLDRNYPNPFTTFTTVRYVLGAPGDVRLDLYDINGRHVRSLDAGTRQQGAHTVTFDGYDAGGRRLASGPYVYQLRVDGRPAESRIMVLF